MIVLRLGLRFARGTGLAGLTRLALMILGTALGVWCLLAATELPAVLHARQDRAAARSPVSAEDDAQARGWYERLDQRVGGRLVGLVFLVSKAGETPLAPGLSHLPDPGRAIVSPALAAALVTRADFRAVLPYRVEGRIADDGLVGPNELYAYLGARRRDLPGGGHALGGFGSADRPDIDVNRGDLAVMQLAFLGFVGIPLAVYFAVCARLSAVSRHRRLAALRLLGMSAGQVRRVNAVESVSAAALGSLIGLGVFSTTLQGLAGSGVAGLVWFPGDAEPSLSTLLLCGVGVPAFAAVLGIAGSRDAVSRALAVRRQALARLPSSWRLLPLVAGIGILAALLATAMSQPRGRGLAPPAPLLMMLAIASTGVGLALGLAVLTAQFAQFIARRASMLWLVLAARRLEFEPGSVTRVVVGFVVLLFGMGFANGVLRDARATTLPLGRTQTYRLQLAQVPPADRASMLAIPDAEAAMVRLSSHVEEPAPGVPLTPAALGVTAIFARCSDLATFLERPVRGCREEVPYRLVPDAAPPFKPPLQAGTVIDFPSDTTKLFNVAAPTAELRVRRDDLGGLGADMLLPPGALRPAMLPDAAELLLASRADSEIADRVSGEVARLAPAARLAFLNDDLLARHRVDVFRRLLQVGLILGVVVGLAAFVVTALDRAMERRANLVALGIVGVPVRTLRAAQAGQVALPLVIGSVLALATGKLAEQVTVAVGGLARGWNWTDMVWTLIGSAAAVGVAVAITVAAVSHRINVSLIRRE